MHSHLLLNDKFTTVAKTKEKIMITSKEDKNEIVDPQNEQSVPQY